MEYRSTFDSTLEGNIGPAASVTMEFLGVPYMVLYPALSVNGRAVMKGELCMGGVLLHGSPTENHPLIPTWDVRIANLAELQSKYSCMELWER